MKTKRSRCFANFPTFATLAVACAASLAVAARAQELDAMPPVVVKTFPLAGATNVTPGEVEIKVTFSKEMRDGAWSWSTAWQNSAPQTIGTPRYEADGRTCVIKVRLEPNRTYGYWLNSEKFKNFKDRQGRPAVPYLLAFETAAQ